MYNTLIRITGESEVAKDLLQEAFVKAFTKVNELEKNVAFPGWLKRIVVNTGIEYTRKKKYQFDSIEELNQEEEELDEELIEPKVLHQAIKELPDGCRAVLALHLLEGYKHSEVADELGISESTSKTQFRHAKKLLRTKLMHHYES